jgi:asparagine synthase (glutamine-hydrolysing)
MQSVTMRRAKTYTIGFDEKEYNEAHHAEAIAKHLGTEHTSLYLRPEEVHAVVPRLPEMYDEPFADISQIPTFLVSRLARSEVTVALSGDGGDEVFGGYNRYVWGDRLYQALSPVPSSVRSLAGRGLTALSPRRWDQTYRAVSSLLPRRARYRLPGEKLHKIGALMTRRTPVDFYLSLVSAWGDRGPVMGEGAPDGAFEEVMRSSGPRSFVERMMLADLVTYLPDNNLAKVDRASMAVSLEVRVPLVDHRLVEWSFRLPQRAKIRDGDTKWMLRQILHTMVPRALVDREKMGFDVPIGAWLRGPLRAWAEELLEPARLDAGGLLRSKEIRRRWADHLEGRRNNGTTLWTVLMLQAWRQHWGC